MERLLLVALGGAFGACARLLVSERAVAWAGPSKAWAGTLTVNVVGGFAMGCLAGWLLSQGDSAHRWRLLLGVGALGGFTTFSAYSLDAWQMLERREYLPALGYTAASVLLSIGALAVGLMIFRRGAL